MKLITKFYARGIKQFKQEDVIDQALYNFKIKTNPVELDVITTPRISKEGKEWVFVIPYNSVNEIELLLTLNGDVVVKLPWIATEEETMFCFSLLEAIQKLYKRAKITDAEGTPVAVTRQQMEEQVTLRYLNVGELLDNDFITTLSGWRHDFYLDPRRYDDMRDDDRMQRVLDDFVDLQWYTLRFQYLEAEKRLLDGADEASLICAVDNKQSYIMEKCDFVGLLNEDNTCKLVKKDVFVKTLYYSECFTDWDAEHISLDKMSDESWKKLYGKLEGIEIENYKKTFVMRWNSDSSDFSLADFEKLQSKAYDSELKFSWDINDYKAVHIGDQFYMIRTGKGRQGVVMSGRISSEPYLDEEVRDKREKTYKVCLKLSTIVHPDKAKQLLTMQQLTKCFPEVNWEEGASGEVIPFEVANRLTEEWQKYVEMMLDLCMEDEEARKYFDALDAPIAMANELGDILTNLDDDDEFYISDFFDIDDDDLKGL